jgi:peptidyl-prolyl cis-trans isomerase D
MLDYIRKRSGGIISFLIIGAIALVFVFWGIGGQDTGTVPNITIDDETVPIQSYLRLKRDTMERMRADGQGMDPSQLNQASAQGAISTLVQRHVIRELAKRTGRQLPETEIVRRITSQPAFQDEQGVFRKSLYERYVAEATGLSVPAFELGFADDVLVSDTANFVQGLVFAPTKALEEAYGLTEDEIKLNYAFFPAPSFAEGLDPTDEEIAAYYEANLESFRIPKEVRAAYVTVSPESFLGEVEVSEEEIQAQYEEELAALTSPPSAEVRHILFKFPTPFYPKPEEKGPVLQKALAAMERLKDEDFADLARELSEDQGSAPKGGSLGTLRKGATVREFEDVAFGAGAENLGVPQGPVETAFGYHIIEVTAYNPPVTKTLEEARDGLEREIRERKARRLASGRIEDLYERVQRDPSLALPGVAAALGLECQESGFFTAAEPPDWLSDPLETQRAAATPVGQSSPPVDIAETPTTPERFLVYQITEAREPRVPPLGEEATREAAREGWIKEASDKLARKAAEDFLALAKRLGFGLGLDQVPGGTAESGATDFFPRLRLLAMAQPPVSSADPGQLLEALFQLARTGDVAGSPIGVTLPEGGGYLVLGLADLRPADPAPLRGSLEPRRRQAMDNLAQGAFAIWAGAEMQNVSLKLPREVQDDASNQTQLY